MGSILDSKNMKLSGLLLLIIGFISVATSASPTLDLVHNETVSGSDLAQKIDVSPDGKYVAVEWQNSETQVYYQNNLSLAQSFSDGAFKTISFSENSDYFGVAEANNQDGYNIYYTSNWSLAYSDDMTSSISGGTYLDTEDAFIIENGNADAIEIPGFSVTDMSTSMIGNLDARPGTSQIVYEANDFGQMYYNNVNTDFSTGTRTGFSASPPIEHSYDGEYLAASNGLYDPNNGYSSIRSLNGGTGSDVFIGGKNEYVCGVSGGSSADLMTLSDGNVAQTASINWDANLCALSNPDASSVQVDRLYVVATDFDGGSRLLAYNISRPRPTADLISPQDNADLDQNVDQTFEYNVSTIDSQISVDLKFVKPDGTVATVASDTQSANTDQSYSKTVQLNQTGIYEWFIDMGGTNSTNRRTFNSVDYSTPTITLNEPVGGSTVKTYSETYTQQFNFSISSDLDGSYTIESKTEAESTWQSVTTGQYSSGSETIVDSGSITLQSDTENREWRVTTSDSIDSTTSGIGSFTVENLTEPDISMSKPVDGKVYYVEQGQTIEIPFEGYINNSDESGTAYARLEEDDPLGADYEVNLGSIQSGTSNFYSDSVTVGTTGNHVNARIDAELQSGNTFSSDSVSFDIQVANPLIENFEATPTLNDVEVGEQINLSIDGQVKNASIDRIVYDLDVNQQDAESFTKQPIDSQNQTSFSDTVNNAFEMREEWTGEELTITATVYDVNGLTSSESVSAVTATPPDDYFLNSPSNGEAFIIPEGQSEASVSFDWGVDTAQYSGTAELVVDGTAVDNFSISSDSSNTQSYTQSYPQGDYNWFVRFTDSNGDTYESLSKSFDVIDANTEINVLNPTDGQTIEIGPTETASVGHEFEIESRPLSNSFNYDFTLEKNGSVVATRTRNDISPSLQTFTETVNNLNNGSYTWTVEMYNSTDSIRNQSSSYSIDRQVLFDLNINRPVDGETFAVDNESSTIDIPVEYNFTTRQDSVDYVTYFDGTQIDTNSVSSDSNGTESLTISDVSVGSHTVTVNGTDADGRNIEKTASFNVDDETIQITNLEFRPSPGNIDPGDEVDIYIQTTGVPEDIDFVEFEVDIPTEGTKEILVSGDELREGSAFTQVAAFTATAAMLNGELSATAEVVTNAGNTIVQTIQGIIGTDREIDVRLKQPTYNETFYGTPGNPETREFVFDITTKGNPVEYDVMFRPNGSSSFIDATGVNPAGTVTETDTTTEVVDYYSMGNNLFIQQQFGTFDWKVNITDTQTGETDVSGIDLFNIEPESDEPILNFKRPEDNDILYINNPTNSRDVEFGYEVDTTEPGTLKLFIEDTQVDEFEVDETGLTTRDVTRTLDTGTYNARVEFDSQSYEAERSITFRIEKTEPPEPDGPELKLKEPSDNATVYQDQGRKFSWSAYGTDSGNMTAYIENADNDVVKTIERDYNTVNETKIYSETIKVDLNLGEYDWRVEFDQDDSQSVTSNERSFTVRDFTPPRVKALSPDGDAFVTETPINFSWSARTFNEDAEIQVRVREENEFRSTVIFSNDQATEVFREYENSKSFQSSGEYDWFVRAKVGTGVTFDSNISEFTVEPENIKDPQFDLINPQQDERFKIPSNTSTATVGFDFETQVFSQADSQVRLLLQNVSAGSDYETLFETSQNSLDETVVYNQTADLVEAGYRYKVQVEHPGGETIDSTVRSFAVGEAEIPKAQTQPGTLEQIYVYTAGLVTAFVSIVGTAVLLLISTVSVLAGGSVVSKFTGHPTMGVVTMLILMGLFVGVGWMPGWFGMILFLLAGGVIILGGKQLVGD